jgi:hypothetical protein
MSELRRKVNTCIRLYCTDVHASPPKLYKKELLATLSALTGHLEEHQPGPYKPE